MASKCTVVVIAGSGLLWELCERPPLLWVRISELHTSSSCSMYGLRASDLAKRRLRWKNYTDNTRKAQPTTEPKKERNKGTDITKEC